MSEEGKDLESDSGWGNQPRSRDGPLLAARTTLHPSSQSKMTARVSIPKLDFNRIHRAQIKLFSIYLETSFCLFFIRFVYISRAQISAIAHPSARLRIAWSSFSRKIKSSFSSVPFRHSLCFRLISSCRHLRLISSLTESVCVYLVRDFPMLS